MALVVVDLGIRPVGRTRKTLVPFLQLLVTRNARETCTKKVIPSAVCASTTSTKPQGSPPAEELLLLSDKQWPISRQGRLKNPLEPKFMPHTIPRSIF